MVKFVPQCCPEAAFGFLVRNVCWLWCDWLNSVYPRSYRRRFLVFESSYIRLGYIRLILCTSSSEETGLKQPGTDMMLDVTSWTGSQKAAWMDDCYYQTVHFKLLFAILSSMLHLFLEVSQDLYYLSLLPANLNMAAKECSILNETQSLPCLPVGLCCEY